MSRTTLNLTPELADYWLAHSLRESAILRQLRLETAQHPGARMQIAPEQGQFMALLVRLLAARRIIEVGVYTGYSSLALALALPEDGLLVACDIDQETSAVAQRYWEAAGVSGRVSLRLAPALETLDLLLATGEAGSYDMIFLDADKTHYLDYYARSLQLLRPGGLLLADNVLWSGRVALLTDQTADTEALRAFNQTLYGDTRIDLSMLPLGDGLTLARKR